MTREPNDLAERYRRLNESYTDRILIFHVGIDAGFFAEYNALMHAMLYCLQHRVQLRLYADDANFGHARGWRDYFRPFCPEVHEAFHHRYNLYRVAPWRDVFRTVRAGRSLRLVKWKLKTGWRHSVGDLAALCAYRRRVLLTRHVRLNLNDRFRVPELGIDGDYLQAYPLLSAIAWRLNEETAAECGRLIASLHLPSDYAGCQIRGGDKVTETALLPPSHYVSLLRRHAPGRDVFVLTDDYRLFRQVQAGAPDIRWHTLCLPGEQGYVNSAFSRTSAADKRERMLRFLASVEALRRARPFVGSVTTGPSLFLLKLAYPHGIPADCRPEDFPAVCRLPIAGRSERAARYLSENFSAGKTPR